MVVERVPEYELLLENFKDKIKRGGFKLKAVKNNIEMYHQRKIAKDNLTTQAHIIEKLKASGMLEDGRIVKGDVLTQLN